MTPRSEETNRRMRRDSERSIVRGALEAFGELGFHRATMQEVARRAGVSKGLIYNYFESKEALVRAIVEERVAEAAERVLQGPEDESPQDRLRRLIDASLDMVIRDADTYRLYFLLLLQPDMRPLIQDMERTLEDKVGALQRLGVETFVELGSDEPVEDALALQFAINGLALTLLIQPHVATTPDHLPLEAIKRRLFARFTRSSP